MVLAPTLTDVEATLLRAGAPVAQLLPGPVLHADMTSAALLLSVPAAAASAAQLGAKPLEILASPSSAISIKPCVTVSSGTSAAAGAGVALVRLRCALTPQRPPSDGRVRLTLLLPRAAQRPPLKMTVHLFVALPADSIVR